MSPEIPKANKTGYNLYIFQYGLVPKIFFPVWLQNQLKSAELEPVLIHTEKNHV